MDRNLKDHVLIMCSDTKCKARGKIFKADEDVILYKDHSFAYELHSYYKKMQEKYSVNVNINMMK